MILTRRAILMAGGGLLASLVAKPTAVLSADPVEIVMTGKPDGSRVWFDPIGIHVPAGQTIRWTNRDQGNSHTTTSYHPAFFERPQRIPEGAEPWDSDYLLPDESFEVTLTVEGVYDFYCVPHEHAGMVGRIVVGNPPGTEPEFGNAEGEPLPEIALKAFPTVAEILAAGVVRGG